MSTLDPTASVRQLLEAHNEKAPISIDVDAYFNKLAEMGGTTNEIRAAATWEDHQEAGLPRILARQVATIFRGATAEREASMGQAPASTIVIKEEDDPEKIARKMTPAQLIEAFPVDQPKHPYTLRLGELAEGRRFMVYSPDGDKDVKTSVKLFEELDDYGEREEVRIGDDPALRKVYRVNERPGKSADEHPLYDGVALRPGGISEVDCDWSKIDTSIRQVLYIAVRETGELNMDEAHEVDIYTEAQDGGMSRISRKYSKAAARLQELEMLNDKPSMKLLLGSSGVVQKTQNPFIVGNRRT